MTGQKFIEGARGEKHQRDYKSRLITRLAAKKIIISIYHTVVS